MDCLHPIFLRGGFVPCGRCPHCRLNRQREWTFRLQAEREASDFTFWLTLTYDNEHLPLVHGLPALRKEDVRHFFEALRKRFRKSISLKHYLVSEYGDGTDRPHYHCLLFAKFHGRTLSDNVKLKNALFDYIVGENSTAWPFGFAYNKKIHSRVYGYITNYVNKPELLSQEHPVKPFTCISQGIGIEFMNRVNVDVKNEQFVVNYQGKKQVLPRYYRDKLLHIEKFSPEYWQHRARLLEVAAEKGVQHLTEIKDWIRAHGGDELDYAEQKRKNNLEIERRYVEKLKKRKDL